LLDIIDKTNSPMGGRLLKRWLALPLKIESKIKERHEVVTELTSNKELLQGFQYQIKQISDLERLVSKVATGKVSPKEFLYLKDSLDAIIPIKTNAEQNKNISLKTIGKQLHDCEFLRVKIATTIH